MTAPTEDQVRRVIELACRAPSVHNTQPWLWRVADESTVELYADRGHQLRVADPDGRNLALSCGAALHQAIESAGALGISSTAELTPVASDHDLLARIRFFAGRQPTDAQERLETIDRRCTDRRRFTSWSIPDARLVKLAQAAAGWGAHAVPITDVTARFRAELLMDRAMTLQAADPRFVEEQATWIEHSRSDGIPASSATPPGSDRRPSRPNRFVAETQEQSQRVVESSDGLMAICTAGEDQASWLQAGEALSALWLHATRAGLSIVPLSQVIEVPETRQDLHHTVFAGMARPQLLLRVGWQEIARTTLPRTPRRPLEHVLIR